MKNVKVVIGANFGDEGKGLTTSYFSSQNYNSLNILHNGGPQRGHTVNNYAFHAYGSSSFQNVPTCYYKTFMINPIAIVQENYNIQEKFGNKYFLPKIFVDENCPLTIPYDIMINRFIEKVRGNNRHGSCGMGIWETYLRHKEYPLYAKDLKNSFELFYKIKEIYENYLPKRTRELNIDNWIPRVSMDGFFDACNKCLNLITFFNNETNIFDNYDTLIFEGSQGLLLDEDNKEYYPNITASATGSKNISKFINTLPKNIDVEICYVTRSYMTRHGAGKFETECHREDINPFIEDKTNIPNEFQGTLRFGWLDLHLLQNSIKNDLQYYTRPIKVSLAITQLNYTNYKLACGKNDYQDVSIVKNWNIFDNIYLSDNKYDLKKYI